MSRILLGVSGGIAAYKALELVRLATALEELEAEAEFPHVVVNDRLEQATEELAGIVQAAIGGSLDSPS